MQINKEKGAGLSFKVLFILVLIFLIVVCNSYSPPCRHQEYPNIAYSGSPPDTYGIFTFSRCRYTRYHILHTHRGIRGYDDRLVLYPDGKVEIARKNGECRQNISQAVRQNLVSHLKKNNSTEPKQAYLPENTCCDLTEYTLKYDGTTIRTMDTATPQFLQAVLKILNKIADECE